MNTSERIASSSRLTETSRNDNLFRVRLILAVKLGFICISFYLAAITSAIADSRVRLGNELFLESIAPELKGKRLGLVVNQTSILPDGAHLADALLREGHALQAIFSPEHGFAGTVEGGTDVKDGRWKGIPVISLYGSQRKPSPDKVRELDAFVYDIQDVGTRFYTYLTTLKYVLEAAAQAGIPVYVLDRPNPLGGRAVEGPFLKQRFESFIGALPIPIRYGLTAGELALMMKGEGWIPADTKLIVVEMENWNRDHFWKDTGLRWIPTSPNIPDANNALAYPGTGLLGGVILSQGLGTPHPFLQFGAPWLDPERIKKNLGEGETFGIELEDVTYTPRSLPGKVFQPPFENRTCRGLFIHIVEPEKFYAVRFALAVIKAVRDLYPERLSPAFPQLNRLFGDDLLELFLKGKMPFEEMRTRIGREEKEFDENRKKYFLY